MSTLASQLKFIETCQPGKSKKHATVKRVLAFVKAHAPRHLVEATRKGKTKAKLCPFLKTTVKAELEALAKSKAEGKHFAPDDGKVEAKDIPVVPEAKSKRSTKGKASAKPSQKAKAPTKKAKAPAKKGATPAKKPKAATKKNNSEAKGQPPAKAKPPANQAKNSSKKQPTAAELMGGKSKAAGKKSGPKTKATYGKKYVEAAAPLEDADAGDEAPTYEPVTPASPAYRSWFELDKMTSPSYSPTAHDQPHSPSYQPTDPSGWDPTEFPLPPEQFAPVVVTPPSPNWDQNQDSDVKALVAEHKEMKEGKYGDAVVGLPIANFASQFAQVFNAPVEEKKVAVVEEKKQGVAEAKKKGDPNLIAFEKSLELRDVLFIGWNFENAVMDNEFEIVLPTDYADKNEVALQIWRTERLVNSDFKRMALSPDFRARQGLVSLLDDNDTFSSERNQRRNKFTGGSMIASVTAEALKGQDPWQIAAWNPTKYTHRFEEKKGANDVVVVKEKWTKNTNEQLALLAHLNGVAPENVLLIDSNASNCKAASRAGFQALFVHHPIEEAKESKDGKRNPDKVPMERVLFTFKPTHHTFFEPFQPFTLPIAEFMAAAPHEFFEKNHEDYGIDTDKLKKWIEAHPVRHRDGARAFSKTIRYVTYDTWHGVMEQMLVNWWNGVKAELPEHEVKKKATKKAKAKAAAAGGQPSVRGLGVSLWLPEFVDRRASVCKSNYWVGQLAARVMTKKFPGVLTEVVTDPADAENQHILYVDDATYSGGQLWSLLESQKKNEAATNLLKDGIIKEYFVLPFLTKAALKLLNPLLKNNINLVIDPAQQVMHTWQELLPNPTPDVIDQVEQAIYPPLFRQEFDRVPDLTTYFEFKMPEHASIAEPIRTGIVWINPRVKRVPFIKNCDRRIEDLNTCPVGVYKLATEQCRETLRLWEAEKHKQWTKKYIDLDNKIARTLPSSYML